MQVEKESKLSCNNHCESPASKYCFCLRGGLTLDPEISDFLHYDTMILQRIMLIVGDARFEYGTSVPEVIISCVTVTCSRVPWPTPRRRGSTSPPPTPPSTPASTSASSGTGHGLDHAVTYNCLHETNQIKKLMAMLILRESGAELF